MKKNDYSAIEILEKEVLYGERGKVNLEEFERRVGEQIDKETYLAYEYMKYDVYVDVTSLLCTMTRIYPNILQTWVLLKVGEFILEDAKMGSYKVPELNHAVLKESIRKDGLSTYRLLGIELN